MSISSTAEWIGRQQLKTLDKILSIHSSNIKKDIVQSITIAKEFMRQEDGSNRSTSDARSNRENTDGSEHVEEEDEGLEGDDNDNDDDDDEDEHEDDEQYDEDEELGKLNDVSISLRIELSIHQNVTYARKGAQKAQKTSKCRESYALQAVHSVYKVVGHEKPQQSRRTSNQEKPRRSGRTLR